MKSKYTFAVKTGFIFVSIIFVRLASLAGPGDHTPPPPGNAPVDPPIGGFGIDGDLRANTPSLHVGDWIPGPGGTGGSVLTEAGAPINPARTMHFIDPWGNAGTDMVFTGGLKWFDDPGTWRWTEGKCSSKTDINNVLFHLATDASGHLWAVVGADRASTSGDSYIDFEFLQNTLAREDGGAFVSQGPHGGRTVNDLLLSLAFTGGGKVADFLVWTWLPDGLGGYAYKEVTDSVPAGKVFAALNEAGIDVPYKAFDKTTYDRYAFAEGTVDLTTLLSILDPCMSLVVKTIMVKTKASQSNTATIEDLIDPIQVTLTIGPGAQAGSNQLRCREGASTAFALHGLAFPGVTPVVTTTWSVVEGDVVLDNVLALDTTAHVSSARAVLRLAVVEESGCVVTDDVELTVADLPPCLIAAPAAATCPGSIAPFTAPAGLASYSWTVAGNASISGPTNQSTVLVAAGPACGQSFTLSLKVSNGTCAQSCETTIQVVDNSPPSLVPPPNLTLDCPSDTGTNSTGFAVAQDDCGAAFLSYEDEATFPCPGSMIIRRTWTAMDGCGNPTRAVQNIVLQDRRAPSLIVPSDRVLECNDDTSPNATGRASASDTCGQATVTFSDNVTPLCGQTKTIRRTWTAIDDCGNQTNAVQTLSVRDTRAPALAVPQDRVLECTEDTSPNATGRASASDTCGQATVSFSDSVVDLCGQTKTIRRTWTAIDDCGNQTNAVQTLSVRDTRAPALVVPQDRVLECTDDTSPNATGRASASDTCGQATVSFSDSVVDLCGQTKTIRRTWTAIDDCGNQTNAVQTLSVRDTRAPALVVPQNRVLECTDDTSPNATGHASASDTCGQATVTFSDSVTPLCGQTKTIRRTWTAIDDCGNRTNAVQTLSVRDTRAPALVVPQDRVLECTEDTSPNATGRASASDTCGQATVTFSDSVTPLCGQTKTIRRTWTAIDDCGNRTNAVQVITVRDQTPPSITVPAGVVLECSDSTDPKATGMASATDACGQASVNYRDAVEVLCGSSKVITRTWTATDACGNQATGVQVIRVEDRTPPVIRCGVAATYTQGGYGGSGTPAAILEAHFLGDFPAGLVVGQWDPANGSQAPNGLFWQPTTQGLQALRSFLSAGGGTSGVLAKDQVNPSSEAKLGELANQTTTVTLNIRFNETGAAGIAPNNFGSVVYTKPGDSLSGLTVSELRDAANRALAGLELPPGYTYSSLTALMDRLNQSFHEGGISDWATAHLGTPSIIVACASLVPPPNASSIQASDACGGRVTITHVSDVMSEHECANRFVVTRTWMAADACGNSSTCEQRIVVNDTSAPVLTGEAERLVPAGEAWDFIEPQAVDACEGMVTLVILNTETNLAGSNALVATRTWEAADACGNSAQFTQRVTVGDTPALESSFDTGTEQWRVVDGASTQGVIQYAGGYVTTTSPAGAGDLFWSAPPAFLGDQSLFYGGVISFRWMLSTPPGTPLRLMLQGDGIVLSILLPAQPSTAWSTVTIGLVEQAGWINQATGQPATQIDMVKALATLTGLLIQAAAEGQTGTAALDQLLMAPPASMDAIDWELDLQCASPGVLHLCWPALATGYVLEECDNLASPNWRPVTAAPAVANALNSVEFPPATQCKYYRLRKL